MTAGGEHKFFPYLSTMPSLFSFCFCASSAATIPPPSLLRRNLAVNLDDEYLVISASAISCEDVVKVGKLLGVIE
jgi:hypothetical protein